MMRSLRLAPLVACVLLAGCSAIDKVIGKSEDSCDGPAPYAAGSTLTDTTGSHDCSGPNGQKGQLYTITLTQQTNVKLAVATTEFAPFLALYTAANKVVEENIDDGAFKAFLPAGSYKLLVSSINGHHGSFTLTSPVVALGGCGSSTGTMANLDMGLSMKGAAFNGTITSTDCGAANAKMHWYRMRLTTGDTLSASVTVDHKAGVALTNASGVTVASKELSGGDAWNTTFVVTTDGWHILRIESRAVGAVSNLPLGYSVTLH